MKLYKEIYHKENLNIEGKTFYREAVRGVILKDNNILMIFSPENGDYKFPGGGIEAGETHEKALKREIQEECGASVFQIVEGIGEVTEFNKPMEKQYDVFKMTSYYYICEVKENIYEQNLDQYEEDLGFQPVWIDIDDVIEKNKAIISSTSKETPRWTRRDTLVLEYIRTEHKNKYNI